MSPPLPLHHLATVRRSDARALGTWRLVPPLGRWAKVKFLHDQLLSERPRWLTRAQIDRMFRDAMRCRGAPLCKRNIMWLAVLWRGLER